MDNPMLAPLWHIPLKRHWGQHGGPGAVPVVEAASGRLVLLVPFNGKNYTSKLATAREVVQAHNKAVRAARKETYDGKKKAD